MVERPEVTDGVERFDHESVPEAWRRFDAFVNQGGMGESTSGMFSPDEIRERYFYGVSGRESVDHRLRLAYRVEYDERKHQYLKQMTENPDQGEVFDRTVSLEVATGPGFAAHEAMGRFYLNPELIATPRVFGKVIDLATKNKTNLSAKIISPEQVEMGLAGRRDKIVVYFSANDSGPVLDVVRQTAYEFGEELNGPAVATTADVLDNRGLPLTGVSFGQDPVNFSRSYSEVRSRIFSSMSTERRTRGDFRESETFRQLCHRSQVDPDDFAFNVGGRDKFEAIESALK